MILFTGGCYPSMHCRCYPSMPCSRSLGGGWYPSMPCRFPGPHPRGKFRGIWSRPTAKGEVEGDLARGGCLLWGVPVPGGSAPGGSVWRPPSSPDGYCCGRYASYWNAFLFCFLSSDVLSNSLFELCNNFTGHTLLSSTMPELDLIAMEKEILKW